MITAEKVNQLHLSGNDPRDDDKMMEWVSPVEWPHQDIMVCRNALPFLKDLIEPAEKHGDWQPCMVTDGESAYQDSSQRSSEVLGLTGEYARSNPALDVYGVMLHAVEGRFVAFYVNQNRHAVINMSSGFDMLRYGAGQRFSEHVDVVPGGRLAARRLSVVAFCNRNFEGGELYFPRQDVRLKPEPGMLALFPSGIAFPHEVEEVTEGVRYSIVTWYF